MEGQVGGSLSPGQSFASLESTFWEPSKCKLVGENMGCGEEPCSGEEKG